MWNLTDSIKSIEAKQDRILAMLTTLLKSLADEDEEHLSLTLDGGNAGAERDQTQSLG